MRLGRRGGADGGAADHGRAARRRARRRRRAAEDDVARRGGRRARRGGGLSTRSSRVTAQFMFPKLFARIAQIYAERYGLTERQLARVAVKNYAHARLNPLAQMRDTAADARAGLRRSPSDNPRHRAAAEGERLLADHRRRGGGRPVLGAFHAPLARERPPCGCWATATRPITCRWTRKDVPDFPDRAQARRRRRTPWRGLTPATSDAADVHDCFSISEIVAYEILGLPSAARAARAARKRRDDAAAGRRDDFGRRQAAALRSPSTPAAG